MLQECEPGGRQSFEWNPLVELVSSLICTFHGVEGSRIAVAESGERGKKKVRTAIAVPTSKESGGAPKNWLAGEIADTAQVAD